MKLTYRDLINNINAIGNLYEREEKRSKECGELLKGSLALCVSRNYRLLIAEYKEHYSVELEKLKEKYSGEELNDAVNDLLNFEVDIPLKTVNDEVIHATSLTLKDIDSLYFMITED